MKKFKNIVILALLSVSLSSPNIPLVTPIYAANNFVVGNTIQGGGIVVHSMFDMRLSKYTHYVVGSDGEMYVLVNQKDEIDLVDDLKGQWINFSGQVASTTSSDLPDSIITNIDTHRLSSVSGAKEIETFSGTLSLVKKLKSDENKTVWLGINGSESVNVTLLNNYTSYSVKKENDLTNKKIGVSGYEFTENGDIVISNVSSITALTQEEIKENQEILDKENGNSEDPKDETDKDEEDEEDATEVGMKEETLDLKITGNPSSTSDGYVEYNVELVKDNNIKTKYIAVFDKTDLKDNFPDTNLKQSVITAKVWYEKITPDGKTILYVKDWKLKGSEQEESTKVKVVSINYSNSSAYELSYVVEADNGKTNTIVFNKIRLGNDYPEDNLLGKTLLITGLPRTEDKQVLDIVTWKVMDESSTGNKEESSTPEKTTQTFRGQLKSLVSYEVLANNIVDSVYTFEDYNGNVYLAHFNSENAKRVVTNDQEGRKLTIEADLKSLPNSKYPVLTVRDFEFNDDDFSYATNEAVALKGDLGSIVQNSNPDRISYKFFSELKLNGTGVQREYVAVFDKNILKDNFPLDDLTGEEMKLYGISYEIDGVHYLGVLSYVFMSEVSNEATSGVGFEVLDLTPTRIVSEDDEEIIYEAVGNNAKKYLIAFQESVLEDKMPNGLLIGQSITVFTQYLGTNPRDVEEDTLFIVNTWTINEENSFLSQRGKLLNVIKESSSAYLYEFQSMNGNVYKVIIEKEIHEAALKQRDMDLENLIGQTVSLYGNLALYDGQPTFVVYGVNVLTQEFINKATADSIVFRGTVKELASKNAEGRLYYAVNQYDEHALLYFDLDLLKDKFPREEDLLNQEIVVQGFLYSDGTLLVSDFKNLFVPTGSPEIPKPLYAPAEYFPNLKGFIGMLDILSTDKTHFTLNTSSRSYVLTGTEEVIQSIEDNVGKIVYLRGELHEQDYTYWTGQINVYDIAPLLKGNSYIKPISEPVDEMKPDPMKNAVHTIQLPTYNPQYEYGDGIGPSIYIPMQDTGKDLIIGKDMK